MKKKTVSITFRAGPPILRKIEAAMGSDQMKGLTKTDILEKALELGLDLLDHTGYEPNKFFLDQLSEKQSKKHEQSSNTELESVKKERESTVKAG